MKSPYKPIDLKGLKTYPLSERKSKVSTSDFAKSWEKGASFDQFLDRLPEILAAADIRKVISALTKAFQEEKTIVMAMGAHVIKVGLNPVVIDLMERGLLSGVAMNGAGIIHDLEIAMTGQTSEDVACALNDGSFGMAHETGAFLSEAIEYAGNSSSGLGEAVGHQILQQKLPLMENSILAAGARLDIPVTVHVALGTDIIHMHPDFDAGHAGKASHRDFRILSALISTLEDGVYMNVGSAVILPEVFLKAVTLVRNLGYRLKKFTTVNMDFIQHYRPMVNVVNRPTAEGGRGFNLVGHHEIMLPLIAAGVIEQLN